MRRGVVRMDEMEAEVGGGGWLLYGHDRRRTDLL